MLDYIKADYLRILKRVPRLVEVMLFYIFCVGTVLYTSSKSGVTWNSVSFVSTISGATTFIPPILGTIELLAVFSDDFKAKTMQVAIGMGISRTKIIAAKLIEVALIILTDILGLLILFIMVGIFTGAALVQVQIFNLAVDLLYAIVMVVGYCSIIMPLIFRTQNMIGGVLLYLVLSSSAIYTLLRLAAFSAPEWFRRLHLEELTLDNYTSILHAHLLMGRLNFTALIGIFVYLALGYLATVWVFRKQELEF